VQRRNELTKTSTPSHLETARKYAVVVVAARQLPPQRKDPRRWKSNPKRGEAVPLASEPDRLWMITIPSGRSRKPIAPRGDPIRSSRYPR
jgi:hypothetical protein